ncbi:MAG: heme-binding protein [Lentisphaeraceae bacterium]|nr:heme-binding protein [Lentisphaeraceae bacterium]
MKSKKHLLIILALIMFMTSSMASTKDIVETAQTSEKFKTLVTAVSKADLVKVLKSKGPFTVLAPTDAAFEKLPKDTLKSLLKPENKDKLISVLKYHVIAGKVEARAVAGLIEAKTILGKSLTVSIKDGRLKIGNANIIGTDIMASNGVIHVIDQVLLPPAQLSTNMQVLKLIETAIEKGVPLYNMGQPEACSAIYEITARSILGLAQDSLDESILNNLEITLRKVTNNESSSRNAWALRKTLDRVYSSLTPKQSTDLEPNHKKATSSGAENDFKVLLEAKLPKGFPRPGPLDKVVLKDYPSYRAARVGGAGMQNFAFMKLFSHIKQNGISMTAPVEMTIDEDSARREDMAFLYGNQQLGKTGKTSTGVDVLDLPSQKFVSIGIRGNESQSAIKSAIAKLENWLSMNNSFTVDGKARLLGYNSPMVPRDKRFWEVQIPIKDKESL